MRTLFGNWYFKDLGLKDITVQDNTNNSAVNTVISDFRSEFIDSRSGKLITIDFVHNMAPDAENTGVAVNFTWYEH